MGGEILVGTGWSCLCRRLGRGHVGVCDAGISWSCVEWGQGSDVCCFGRYLESCGRVSVRATLMCVSAIHSHCDVERLDWNRGSAAFLWNVSAHGAWEVVRVFDCAAVSDLVIA